MSIVKYLDNEFKIVFFLFPPNFINFSIQQKLLVLKINGNKQTLGVSVEIESTLKYFIMYAIS